VKTEAREMVDDQMKSKGMWKTLIKRSRQQLSFRKAQPSLFVKHFTEIIDEARDYWIT
jgi:hypothetical protein